MTRTVILSVLDVDQEVVEARAAQVGADILARYRRLALDLRQSGWGEAAAIGDVSDPTERAVRRCAFQLYGTAASEMDNLIADVLDSLEHPFTATMQTRTLRLLDDRAADRSMEDESAQ
jgi:hypothetical protein